MSSVRIWHFLDHVAPWSRYRPEYLGQPRRVNMSEYNEGCNFNALTACGALPPIPLKNRKASIASFDLAKPHIPLNIRNHKLASCNTLTRPNTSERGPIMNGPMANPSRKIAITNICRNSDLMSKSSAMVSSAGATIVDARGEIKVKHDTSQVPIHFRAGGQFSGL